MLYQEKLNQYDPDGYLYRLWIERSKREQEGFEKWMNEIMDETVEEYVKADKPILHLYQYLRGIRGVLWSWKGQAMLQADVEALAHYVKSN